MNSFGIRVNTQINNNHCNKLLFTIARAIVCSWGSPRRPGRPRGVGSAPRRAESCARGERSSSSQGIGRPESIVCRSLAPSPGARNRGPAGRLSRRCHGPPRRGPMGARPFPRTRLPPPRGTRAVAPPPSRAGPPCAGGSARVITPQPCCVARGRQPWRWPLLPPWRSACRSTLRPRPRSGAPPSPPISLISNCLIRSLFLIP